MMQKKESRDSKEAFWNYSGSITSIIFEDRIDIPAEVEEDKKWDVSADHNGSVMAYIEPDNEGSTTYRLHIQGKGGIAANTDSSYLFYNFSKVTSIEGLEHFDTTNVTRMDYMFYECSDLTSLDVSNFDITNVTVMIYIFGNCSSLTSLDVTGFNTAKVTNMTGMFGGCSSLTSLDVSSFDTSNVTSIASMFSGCSGLTSLDVSSFDTSKVTNMIRMFYGCSNLTSLDLSSFDMVQITNSYDKIDVFNLVKNDCLITVKDEATKGWVLNLNDALTNVVVKGV